MVATRQYLEDGQRLLASAPDLQSPLWGLTLSHPLFSETHWLINRPYSLTISGQLYRPCYFQLVLPSMDGKGQQDAQLSIQNVDRVIVDELERANASPGDMIEATIRLFIEDDLAAGAQNVPLVLSFSNIQASSSVVSGIAGRSDVLNRPFPLEVYRIDRWPGLDR